MQTLVPFLVARVRATLVLSQAELAARIGSSRRTVQRWEAERSTPAPWELQRMADHVRSLDAELAAQLDALAPRPAAVAPPPVAVEPPAPPPPPIPMPVLVDSVVCAAAEAMSVTPQAIRPAVLAAFGRALDARLSAQDVVGVLAPPPPPAPAPASEAKAKGARR